MTAWLDPAPSMVTSRLGRHRAGDCGDRGVDDRDVVFGGVRPGVSFRAMIASSSPVLSHHAVNGWKP
ncbi:hypothetical protein [Mycolicibacterium doricum]|uniref:hypothetical protein n=1 Tax=Mycolicibacterium doricum TaxID=126673 RepID=UPI001C6552E0|nr:hypothetical protein [Mycolicibacterium doricum]